MEHSSEMMGDTMDDALDDDETEGETSDLVNQVCCFMFTHTATLPFLFVPFMKIQAAPSTGLLCCAHLLLCSLRWLSFLTLISYSKLCCPILCLCMLLTLGFTAVMSL